MLQIFIDTTWRKNNWGSIDRCWYKPLTAIFLKSWNCGFLSVYEDNTLGYDRFSRSANFSNLNIYGFLIVFADFYVFNCSLGHKEHTSTHNSILKMFGYDRFWRRVLIYSQEFFNIFPKQNFLKEKGARSLNSSLTSLIDLAER